MEAADHRVHCVKAGMYHTSDNGQEIALVCCTECSERHLKCGFHWMT